MQSGADRPDLLLLLWQPAMIVGELSSQQNIIAVVVDDSRSMSIADSRRHDARSRGPGRPPGRRSLRSATSDFRPASTARQHDSRGPNCAPVDCARRIRDAHRRRPQAACRRNLGSARRRGGAAERRRREHAGLGGSGISPDALAGTAQSPPAGRIPSASATRSVRHDVEIEDVSLAAQSCRQRARDRHRQPDAARLHRPEGHAHRARRQKTLATREVTLGPDGRLQAEPLFFPAGAAGAKEPHVLARAAAGRRESAQQRSDAAASGERCQAPHPLHRGRAALGIQIHPPR